MSNEIDALRARLAADRCDQCAGRSSGVAYCVNCGRPFAWKPGEERLTPSELRARLAEVERERERVEKNYQDLRNQVADAVYPPGGYAGGRTFDEIVRRVQWQVKRADDAEASAQALAAALGTLTKEAEYLETFSEYGSTNARAVARKIRAALAAARREG